jgi:cyclohexanone monooxygenase
MTGALKAMNIKGAGGLTLDEAWRDGPRTYLGLMVAGFPNLFLVNGPGSPSVLCNMLVAVEQHVDWIAAAIAHLRETGHSRIEALPEAQAAWVDEVRLVADRTLYPRANSWYNGDNVPGKTRVFLPYVGGFDTYTRRCEDVVADGYAGFRLSPA